MTDRIPIIDGYEGTLYVPDVYTLRFKIYKLGEPEDELVAEGFLKWDGCLNVMFPEAARNEMTHFCSPKDVDRFAEALKWVWTKGRQIPAWPMRSRDNSPIK